MEKKKKEVVGGAWGMVVEIRIQKGLEMEGKCREHSPAGWCLSHTGHRAFSLC